MAAAQLEHKAVGAARASLRSTLNEGEMGSLALGRSLRQPSSTYAANRGQAVGRSALTGGAKHARLKVLQRNPLDFSEGEQRDGTNAFEVMGLFTDGATFARAAGIIGGSFLPN